MLNIQHARGAEQSSTERRIIKILMFSYFIQLSVYKSEKEQCLPRQIDSSTRTYISNI